LALAGMIGPVWFTALVIVHGLLVPDYSHVRMTISALGALPNGWIQTLNSCGMGLLTAVFALALHESVRPTRRGARGPALLALSALGIVATGVFPWRMIDGVPTETPAHVAGAVTGLAATGAGAILLSRRMKADPAWRGLSTYTLTTGIAVLILFVTAGMFAVNEGTPLHPWAGLVQRVMLAVWFLCMIVLARRMRRPC
jgi:hypothetical membrane protein